jgi:aminoglycoside 3'-phosphotransferase-2
MHLPAALVARLEGFTLERIQLGESGAAVYRCSAEGEPTHYLKAAPLAISLRLDGEAERTRWLKHHGVPVPTVHEYGCIEGTEYLLVEEVTGFDAADQRWTPHLPSVIPALGTALATLHRTSIDDCPFDQRIASQLAAARVRIRTGQVDEDDFDESRLGRSATELFADVLTTVPEQEDLVLTHGDYCLPNVVLRHAGPNTVELAGLIDCARAGIADRHQDLALAMRSITYNFGDRWVPAFLSAYGLPEPDAKKVAFFTLLDEFF